jgi:hypothetical protein
MRKWIPRTVTVLCLTALLASPCRPAAAKSPHTVDPLTMTPALNPNFAPWTCFLAGSGITCQGQLDQTYADELTDIPQCDGKDVYVTGEEHASTTRWHDLDGRAVKTSLQTDIPGDRLTLSPTGDGDAVFLSAHFHKHYVYVVPGDLSSRVLTETGAMLRLTQPGTGVLFQDTGTVTFAPEHDEETVTVLHGKHELYAGTTDLDTAICDALT